MWIRIRMAMHTRCSLVRFTIQLQSCNHRVMVRRPVPVITRANNLRGHRSEVARVEYKVDSRPLESALPAIEARLLGRPLRPQLAKAVYQLTAIRIIFADELF